MNEISSASLRESARSDGIEYLLKRYAPALSRMEPDHGPQVTALFLDLFPDYFLSRFGPRFLNHGFWRQFWSRPDCFGFVWLDGNRVSGYAAGTTARASFMSNVVRSSPLLFVRSTIIAALRRPIVIGEGIDLFLRLKREAEDDGPGAELLAFGVAPRSCRVEHEDDTRPADILMKATVAEFRNRNASSFRLYTTATNHLACRFYRRMEFSEQKRFRMFGEDKICFVRTAME